MTGDSVPRFQCFRSAIACSDASGLRPATMGLVVSVLTEQEQSGFERGFPLSASLPNFRAPSVSSSTSS